MYSSEYFKEKMSKGHASSVEPAQSFLLAFTLWPHAMLLDCTSFLGWENLFAFYQLNFCQCLHRVTHCHQGYNVFHLWPHIPYLISSVTDRQTHRQSPHPLSSKLWCLGTAWTPEEVRWLILLETKYHYPLHSPKSSSKPQLCAPCLKCIPPLRFHLALMPKLAAWAAMRNRLSHSSGDWEVQGPRASKVGFIPRPLLWFISGKLSIILLCVHMTFVLSLPEGWRWGRASCSVSLHIEALIQLWNHFYPFKIIWPPQMPSLWEIGL